MLFELHNAYVGSRLYILEKHNDENHGVSLWIVAALTINGSGFDIGFKNNYDVATY